MEKRFESFNDNEREHMRFSKGAVFERAIRFHYIVTLIPDKVQSSRTSLIQLKDRYKTA